MSSKEPLIMIVEDDAETAMLNARMLKRRGNEVVVANSIADAKTLIKDNTPDLFVLDIVLPDGDGLALCKELRQRNDAPILFLTGKKSTEDKIAGLSQGGDYFLTKPYSVDEFLVVVERLLQRTAETQKKISEASEIKRGALTLNLHQRAAFVNGCDAVLTHKEFSVLLILVQNEGMEIASEEIYERVWNSPMHGDSGALRVQIARLKKKLDEENADDFSILHIHSKGYMFTTE